jgi:hypothetical protein
VTSTHRQIIEWLKAGARIWAPARARLAYVVLPTGHPDEFKSKPWPRAVSCPVVRVATLQEMEEAELVDIHSGGTLYSDSVWVLPGTPEDE